MRRIAYILAFLLASAPLFGQAGTTLVSATVVDTLGSVYSNCQWSVVFIGENTTPGAGPYAPAAYTNGQQGTCNSFGQFSVNLGDNLNTITPTPSQWSFSICSSTGYLGGPFCATNVLITITGATQDISSILTPLMPRLPSGTGPGTSFYQTFQSAGIPLAQEPNFNFITGANMTINCTDNLAFLRTDCTFISSGGGGGAGIIVNPVANQNIIQPVATGFGSNNYNSVRTATLTNFNWAATLAGAGLTGAQTLTFASCPLGIFGTDTTSFVVVNNNAEVAQLTGSGTCVPGSAGNIKFTLVGTYSNPTIASASTGIQEAIIDAESSGTGTHKSNYRVTLAPTNPPNTNFYAVYAPVTIDLGIADIDMGGASIDVETKRAAFVLPTLSAEAVVIHGVRVATKTTMAGVAITNTACSANTATITSTFNPGTGPDIYVDIQGTDETTYWGIHKVASSSPTSFTFSDSTTTGCSLASHATPGGVAYEHAFIEDNGNNLTVRDFTLDPPSWAGANLLNSIIIVQNDQSFNLDIPDSPGSSSGTNCDANYCGQWLYAPGPFTTAAALGRVRGGQLSLSCQGNGIKWMGGNTLDVQGVVIQAFSQFSILSGIPRGGFGATFLHNVYNEVGSCTNPLMSSAGLTGVAARAMMGVGSVGSIVKLDGQSPGSSGTVGGQQPQFATGGATTYQYYIVVHDTTSSLVSNALLFGQATPSGGGAYTIGWPRVAVGQHTITYDVLKVTGTGLTWVAPFSTGNYSIATSVAQCAGSICTMSDSTGGAVSSYTLSASPTLFPQIPVWPSGIMLSSQSATSSLATSLLFTDDLPVSTLSPIVATTQNTPTVFAQRCGALTPGLYISCLAGNSVGNSNAAVGGTIIQNGAYNGGQSSNLKGRQIYETFGSLNPGHIITLVDSNPFKTYADPNHRPGNDSTDTFLGLDNGNVATTLGQLAMGSPVSITGYIGNVGDNTNWIWRSTSSLFSTKVPITSTGIGTFGGSSPTASGNILFGCNSAESTASASHIGIGALNGTCSTPYLNLIPLGPTSDAANYVATTVKDAAGNMVQNFSHFGDIDPMADTTHVTSDLGLHMNDVFKGTAVNNVGPILRIYANLTAGLAINTDPFAGITQKGCYIKQDGVTINTDVTIALPNKCSWYGTLKGDSASGVNGADAAIAATSTFRSTYPAVFSTGTTDVACFATQDNGIVAGTNGQFTISTISRTSNVVTLVTSSASGYTIGHVVIVAGVTDTTFNGSFTLTNVSGTTLTYSQTAANASSSSGNTQSCVLGSATPFTSNLPGYVMYIFPAGTANPAGLLPKNSIPVGIVQSFTDSKHISLWRNIQSPITIPASSTGFEYGFLKPLFIIGMPQSSGAGCPIPVNCIGNQQRLENVSLNCGDDNSGTNSNLHVGIVNMYGQEQDWWQNIGTTNCAWEPWVIASTGTQDSGPYSGIIGASTGTLTSSIPIFIYQTGYWHGLLGNTTINTGLTQDTNILYINTISGGGGMFQIAHLESATDGITCGSLVVWPWSASTGCRGTVFMGTNVASTVTNVVHFVNATGTASSNDVVMTSGGNGSPVAILDDIHGTSYTVTTGGPMYTISAPVWADGMRIPAVLFASLPACAAGTEGLQAAVSDSSTNTWGATVTGSSTNHIMAVCDGTNWTVMGK